MCLVGFGLVRSSLICFSLCPHILRSYTARLIFYAFMGNAWSVLPIEALHGVTFGVFYSSAVAHVHTLASKEASYFFQGVFTGVMSSGRAIGSIGG